MDKTLHQNRFSQIDAFIKLILAVMIAIMPFLFEEQMSLSVLVLYLMFVTVISKIRGRTLLLSAASYGIIVLFPYFFGLLIHTVLYFITQNTVLSYSQGTYEVFLRLFRLFVIWYVSILYFQSTPMKTVLGLLDKLLFPLSVLGIPVKDYLKVVMCIVLELKDTGTKMKDTLLGQARSSMGGSQTLKNKFNGISQIIVSMLVNSFENLDRIQSFVEQVKPEELYSYRFRIASGDILAILSVVILTAVVFVIETGLWL